MERERTLFRSFLGMHAHKASVTEEPVAHLQFYSDVMPHDMPLLAFNRDDVVDALDAENSELVRWLLEQLRTYDCTREKIVGLIFDEKTVLSEVLRIDPVEE